MIQNPFLKAILDAGGDYIGGDHKGRKLGVDTVETARAKAIALVRENRNWFQLGLGKQPNLIYKREGNTYRVGIKYANRFLKAWCEDGFDNYEDVEREHMLQIFDALVWDLEQGNCDAALQVVIDDIARMRKSKTA